MKGAEKRDIISLYYKIVFIKYNKNLYCIHINILYKQALY